MTNDKFVFDEDTHTYRLGDRVIPGHTRVLDMSGLVPYGAIAPDILERKSAIGRAVHFACFLHDEGKPFTSDPHIRGYIDAWIDFRKQTGFTPSLREHRGVYYFHGLPFGMQIDALGRFKNMFTQEAVVEIKTCSTIQPHHGIQLAAQAGGVETKGSKFHSIQARFLARDRYVCQLFETGRWKLHPFKLATDLEMFEH